MVNALCSLSTFLIYLYFYEFNVKNTSVIEFNLFVKFRWLYIFNIKVLNYIKYLK